MTDDVLTKAGAHLDTDGPCACDQIADDCLLPARAAFNADRVEVGRVDADAAELVALHEPARAACEQDAVALAETDQVVADRAIVAACDIDVAAERAGIRARV